MKLYCLLKNNEEWERVRAWVKKEVDLIQLADSLSIPPNSKVLLSDEAMICGNDLPTTNKNGITLYCLDKIEELLKQKSWEIYHQYESYYLNLALKRAESPETSCILLGFSYAKCGLSAPQIGEQCVNLALDSQDIYYSTRIGEQVIRTNPHIRNVVIGGGYVWPHSSLSRAANGGSHYAKELIEGTYFPIFHDAHGAKNIEKLHAEAQLAQLHRLHFMDTKQILHDFCKKFYHNLRGESARVSRRYTQNEVGQWLIQNHYPMTQQERIVKLPGLSWAELPAIIKDSLSKNRTINQHNKLTNHLKSLQENLKLLSNFIALCNEKHIAVYFLNMPQTANYMKYVEPKLIKQYEVFLDEIPGEFHYIDYHDIDIFTDEDYIDQDHLGPKGAEKVTSILMEVMKETEGAEP